MLNNSSFFLYKDKKNIMKYLHPVSVTFLLFLFSIIILLNEELILTCGLFLGSIVFGLFCGETIKSYVKFFLHTRFFILSMFLFCFFIKISLLEICLYFFRVYSLLILSRLYIKNMKRSSMEQAFAYFLGPLRMFKIDGIKVAKSLSLAIFFLSIIYEEALKTWKSMQSRGILLYKCSIYKKAKWMQVFLIPLFRKTETIADQVADSLIVKGFTKSEYGKVETERFHFIDGISLLCSLYLFLYVVLKRVM